MCEWGAIERVQSLGKAASSGSTPRRAPAPSWCARISKIDKLTDLRNVPIAVTWHAGTFYAAIEVLKRPASPFDDIKLVHANDRLDALLSGKTEAAALMEPLVSRAREAGAAQIADLRWRGGIVAGDDVDEETAAKIMRALNRAVAWLAENESRSREELLARSQAGAAQDRPVARAHGRAGLQAGRVPGKGRLDDGPRLPQGRAGL